MDELKKHKVALFLILGLAFVRFIAIPVIEWQEETISAQKMLERKISKSNQLITNKALIDEQKKSVNDQLALLEPLFYHPQNLDEFKLNMQKEIESGLAENELTSKRIGWQLDFEMPDSNIKQVDLEYNFEGDGYKVIDYLLGLYESNNFIQTSEFSLSFRGQREGRIGIISVYMRRSFYLLPPVINNAEQ